nr:E2 early protein [Bos taurus papillomavirus 9]QYI89639.1 E2 early protein [Bos taurus papillomavirus 9]
MDSLEARFESVQEQLLQIYETDSQTLEVAITYWSLIRREHALYYRARQEGKTRLGLYPVPPSRVSEKKAKDAIKIYLHLQSLQQSEFANLKWSLVDTSLENFLAAPENTFKKKGQLVTVVYDSDANNSMVYTAWREIYYVDEKDTWRRTHSQVDHDGIFYEDAQGNKVYYVNFHDDAALYSNLGRWEVHFENHVLSPPVTSSVSGGPAKHRRPQAGDHSPGHTSAAAGQYTGDSGQRHTRSRSRSRSRSRTPTRPTSGGPPRKRGRGGGTHTGGSPTEVRRHPGGTPPPTAEQVGVRHRTPERKTASRLTHLIEEAFDPPILLLQGAANTLKCFRRRATHSHPHRFLCMSTSWTWASKTSTLKSGHRMLVAFSNFDQRTNFLANVHLPKGVTAVTGSLDGL